MCLRLLHIVLLSWLVVCQTQFTDTVCDGHHHQQNYWMVKIPETPPDLAQLYTNKCINHTPNQLYLDPKQRQYVTFKHKDDTHIHKFDYQGNTIKNSIVNLYKKREYIHEDTNCRALEEDDMATCNIPVEDLTSLVDDARGIPTNQFVVSYLLPKSCETCIAQIELQVDEKETKGRRKLAHDNVDVPQKCGDANQYSTSCPCPTGFWYCNKHNLQNDSHYKFMETCCDWQGLGGGGCWCDGSHYVPSLGRDTPGDNSSIPVSCTGSHADGAGDPIPNWRSYGSYDENDPKPKPDNCWYEALDSAIYEPTQAPTSAPSQAPTSAPSQAPTSAPSQGSSQAPTSAPTVYTPVAHEFLYDFKERAHGERDFHNLWIGTLVISSLFFFGILLVCLNQFFCGENKHRKNYAKV